MYPDPFGVLGGIGKTFVSPFVVPPFVISYVTELTGKGEPIGVKFAPLASLK